MLVSAYSFFRLAAAEKAPNVLPECCGYRPCGVEYSSRPDRPDQIESFTVSARVPDAARRLPSESARLLYRDMRLVFEALQEVVEAITVEIATSIAGTEAAAKLCGRFRTWSRLQLNYSRPRDCPWPWIHEIHEDGNLLTIAGTTAPGLEIMTRNSVFTPIPTAPGEVLVMPGEIAWLLSGGAVQPLYHRVVPTPGVAERIAFLFFGDLDPGVCIPWAVNSTNAGIDIGARVRTNVNRFGLSGFNDIY